MRNKAGRKRNPRLLVMFPYFKVDSNNDKTSYERFLEDTHIHTIGTPRAFANLSRPIHTTVNLLTHSLRRGGVEKIKVL